MEFSEEELQEVTGDYLQSDYFSPEEKAAMRWAEVMTEKQYQASPGNPPQHHDALDELKKYYDDGQVVELSFVSGFFNFWNRFTDILEIDIEQGALMASFSKSAGIDGDDFTAFMRDCWWNEGKDVPQQAER